MTRPFDVKAEARRLLQRTRTAQGLPVELNDPVAARKVAALLSVSARTRRQAS